MKRYSLTDRLPDRTPMTPPDESEVPEQCCDDPMLRKRTKGDDDCRITKVWCVNCGWRTELEH